MHKIRSGMGKRDEKYILEGIVELDEWCFEIADSNEKNLKRGRGSQSKRNVAVMAESTPLENLKTGKNSSHFRYAKMKTLNSHKFNEINDVATDSIEKTL